MSIPRTAKAPESMRVSFGERGTNILLVHASPRRIYEYIYEDHPAEDLLPLFNDHKVDVMVSGTPTFPTSDDFPFRRIHGSSRRKDWQCTVDLWAFERGDSRGLLCEAVD